MGDGEGRAPQSFPLGGSSSPGVAYRDASDRKIRYFRDAEYSESCEKSGRRLRLQNGLPGLMRAIRRALRTLAARLRLQRVSVGCLL